MNAAARVEVWVWVMVYGGLILIGLGLATQRGDAAIGWLLVVAGIVAAAIGCVLVWVRSRMNPRMNPDKETRQ